VLVPPHICGGSSDSPSEGRSRFRSMLRPKTRLLFRGCYSSNGPFEEEVRISVPTLDLRQSEDQSSKIALERRQGFSLAASSQQDEGSSSEPKGRKFRIHIPRVLQEQQFVPLFKHVVKDKPNPWRKDFPRKGYRAPRYHYTHTSDVEDNQVLDDLVYGPVQWSVKSLPCGTGYILPLSKKGTFGGFT
jgi:hypothetical protein